MAAAFGVLCALAAGSAGGQETLRHHGFRLDERHLLLLEQRHREIEVGIATRSRNIGDTSRTRTRDDSSEAAGRFETVDYLVKITAEVLKPSAPNYLSNPGERYRLTVEGLSLDPDYVMQAEVDAIVARETVLSALGELSARASGIQREALHYAGPYVLQVLNETGLMPAPIPESIQESQAGRIRFDNPALQRESLEAGRKLYAGEKPKPATRSPLAGQGATAGRAGGKSEQRKAASAGRGG
ncbi:MAG TPA: hypothetical protein PLD73_11535 [Candidatus Hydrogenedentes bacterium]|nr:hypothetical protein [Candidatus Hydrogenedentota bacterium]